jgi:alkylhydroperoxidase family enzyme
VTDVPVTGAAVTAAGGPRLAPLPREQWDDDVRTAVRMGFPAVAERFLATGPDALPVPNAIGTMLRHPHLTGPFLAYNGVLLFDPTLEPRHRELVVLRVASRTHSAYEWTQHARLALRYDVSPDEIDALEGGGDGDGERVDAAKWSPLEADLLAATDQLVDRHRIDDATWARLAEALDDRQLVELVFVVGTYTCLAMAFNSFGVELDADRAPSTTPSRPDSQE